MDSLILSSRRSILKGLGIAALAGAVPVTLTIAPAIGAPNADRVAAAILEHRKAWRAVVRLLDEVDRLEGLPGRPEHPKVSVGNLLHWDENHEQQHTPIVASSHAEISRYCTSRAAIGGWPAAEETVRQRYAGLHRDLTRQIRARACFDRRSGLAACLAALRASWDAEKSAAAALMLALPTTQAQAARKVAYITRHGLADDLGESTVGVAVMRWLC